MLGYKYTSKHDFLFLRFFAYDFLILADDFFIFALFSFQLYELKASEIKVGNGNCGWNFTDDGLLYSNLSQCGLKRISQRDFNIMVRHCKAVN